ncbi:lipopolysaccharide biosynthesis protein [Thermodesulfatator indicus DSM 15286]|uniref:Lipopolysaccharide biosynthesis protein n=1 Tax=Thermodesulfatator indicus (strain DSM 15286 / JCM 11887 / CIR29812) TaxID=667014 RepID=F8A849_THEID|nr:lipopolysaccharide biosynthesis protein [Thermodesulfatator indicus]AEH45044.1 lipopolysaccharide biosynthesis protein [Thermodesulfatator indicus DSM 15286]
MTLTIYLLFYPSKTLLEFFISEGKSQKEKLDPIHQQLPPCQPYPPPYYEEDEIDLYELWLVLKKRKNLILGLTFGLAFLVAIYQTLFDCFIIRILKKF